MDRTESRDPGTWSADQVALATLSVVAVVGVAWLIYLYRGVVALLLLAIVLSTAVRPLVMWLRAHGIPRALGVVLVYLATLVLLSIMAMLVAPPLVAQVGALVARLPAYYQALRDALLASPSPLLQNIAESLPPEIVLAVPEAPVEGAVGTVVVQSLAYANAVVGGLLSLAAVFLLGFYWTLEGRTIVSRLVRWASPQRRDTIEALVGEIEDKLGRWVLAELLLAGIVGTVALVAYLIIGLPFAVVLAVIAAVMEVVPIIGPWVAGAAAVLVALSTDPTRVIWTIVAMMAIQFAEGNLLVPRLMRRVVGTHPLVTLLALAAFSSLFGFAGVLLAVPIAAAIQIVLDRLVVADALSETPRLAGRSQASVLRYQVQELMQEARRLLVAREAPHADDAEFAEDTVEAIAVDLDRLLARVSGEGGER